MARVKIEAELVETAYSDFYRDTVDRLKGQKDWGLLVDRVLKHQTDPETAASQLAKTIRKLNG
jgi:hypothetical protein